MREYPQSAIIIDPDEVGNNPVFENVRSKIKELEKLVEDLGDYDWHDLTDNCHGIAENEGTEDLVEKLNEMIVVIELDLGEIVGRTISLQSVYSEAEGHSSEVQRAGYFWEASIDVPKYLKSENWITFG